MTQFSSGKHRPLTNPANPILAYARDYLTVDQSESPLRNLCDWLGSEPYQLAWIAGTDPNCAPRRLAHARAVLSRLARLADAS